MNIMRDLVKYGLERFGLYYSSYRGYVVENKDESGMNRVMVRVPYIHGNSRGLIWAYPKGSISGKGYGFSYTPQIGEQVWVEFEFGNLRNPIYTPSHFNKGFKPVELEGNTIGFKSPAGNLIKLDEDNKVITIYTPDGEIVLNEGSYGGLIKISELLNKLNAVENKVNTLIQKYNTHTHPGVSPGGSSTAPTLQTETGVLTVTKKEDIENPKVKH